MKILYISSLYHPHALGGAEITLKTIADGVRARGHEVVVLATGAGPELQVDEIDGVRVYRAPVENLYWPYACQSPSSWTSKLWHLRDSFNRRMQRHVRAVLDAERPDIASCHNLAGFSASVWDVLADRNIPIVQVLHDHYLRCPRGVMFVDDRPCTTQCRSCKALRLGHRRRSQLVSAVVGISHFMLRSFACDRYFPGARQLVIHNARHAPEGRAPHEMKEGPPVFGFMGTLSKVKGIEWLLDSFRSVDAKLVVAGRGRHAYEQALRDKYASDKVRFIGQTSATDFYRQVDVCIVPSLWEEPLGMVPVEAAANHVPVIATNRGGLPESVQHGINGLICDPEQHDSLLDAMKLLVGDQALRKSLSENARASVAEFIDVGRMVDQYERLYLQLLEASVTR